MTHIYEDEFHERVSTWLHKKYGGENVEHEVYLPTPDSWLYCDFVVQTDVTTWAIEVEKSAEKIGEGFHQSVKYAYYLREMDEYEDPVTPCIVVPHGHSEYAEWAREQVTVKETPEF